MTDQERRSCVDALDRLSESAARLAVLYHDAARRLESAANPSLLDALADMRQGFAA